MKKVKVLKSELVEKMQNINAIFDKNNGNTSVNAISMLSLHKKGHYKNDPEKALNRAMELLQQYVTLYSEIRNNTVQFYKLTYQDFGMTKQEYLELENRFNRK